MRVGLDSIIKFAHCALRGAVSAIGRLGVGCFAIGLLAIVAAQVCAVPGRDGSPSIAGVVNTYWSAANGTYSAASTSIALQSKAGATPNIAPGDLVLIIQMQCANINFADALTYGDGVNAEPASGYSDPSGSCLAGRYEFVRAGPATTATTLDLSGSPLQHTYVQAEATNTTGRRTMQVIRVPQYQDVTLTGTVTAAPWNGLTGGIVALDVAGTLNLGGQMITVDGLGFRGGGVTTGSQNDPQQRFRWDNPNRHGGKGEGIAGTPRLVSEKRSPDNGNTAPITDLGSAWGGYPTGSSRNGDFARGAPGNAGGGGTFWNSVSDNGGGGGGGNGGAGGRGGAGWRAAGYVGIAPDYSNIPEKKWGFGGSSFLGASVTRAVMGGGGGAGDNNGNSEAAQSAGAAGGGIIMLRAGRLTGSGTFSARGARAADNPLNDGAGGGGAGGTVIAIAPLWEISNLTINAQGGRGGDAWRTGNSAHGPGGGGGGGVVLVSGPATINVAGGQNGLTTTADNPSGGAAHGAQPGVVGQITGAASDNDTPGSAAGYRCQIDLQLVKRVDVSGPEPGETVTYTLTVTNLSPAPASGVVLTDSFPMGVVPLVTSGCAEDPMGVPSCTLGSLAALSSVSVSVTAEVIETTLGAALTNVASVTAAQSDPNTANNSASVTVTVSGLVLTKSVCNVTAAGGSCAAGDYTTTVSGAPGDVLEYRVRFERIGPPIFDVLLTDEVPPHTIFQTDSYGPGGDVNLTCPDGATVSIATGVVTTVSLDLADHCALSTAVRADGVTVSEAILNGDVGFFNFRVRIP